jgi:organic hydroperoxide reductase OsmC/OhrA
MSQFPHDYRIAASATAVGDVTVGAEHIPPLTTAAPAAFGGPGDKWSPEDLLVAAVADCFILSFRAIARASRLEWTELRCEATGTLDRPDKVTRFTHMEVSAALTVPAGTDLDKAEKLLHRPRKTAWSATP